jgi:hypothetical protein
MMENNNLQIADLNMTVAGYAYGRQRKKRPVTPNAWVAAICAPH